MEKHKRLCTAEVTTSVLIVAVVQQKSGHFVLMSSACFDPPPRGTFTPLHKETQSDWSGLCVYICGKYTQLVELRSDNMEDKRRHYVSLIIISSSYELVKWWSGEVVKAAPLHHDGRLPHYDLYWELSLEAGSAGLVHHKLQFDSGPTMPGPSGLLITSELSNSTESCWWPGCLVQVCCIRGTSKRWRTLTLVAHLNTSSRFTCWLFSHLASQSCSRWKLWNFPLQKTKKISIKVRKISKQKRNISS